MKLLVKLYDKTLEWSQHPHAERYLAAVSFLDASVLPVPPYIMLAPMALAKPHRAYHLALIATIASVLGALLGYLLGYLLFKPLMLPLIEYFGHMATYQHALEAFQKYGILTLIVLGITPIPYKIAAIAAGFLALPLHWFILVSIFSRGLKFFVIALVVKAGGRNIEQFFRTVIEKMGIIFLGLGGLALYIYLR